MQITEMHFLVAEDHDFQRKTLVRMLTSMGAKHVSEAADGKAALEIFTDLAQPIDIIISDLDMPGMDGMAFMRHLGELGVPVSVILSSALDSALISSVETMTKAYGITLLGAIEKPITPQKLEFMVRKYVAPQRKAAKAAAAVFPLEEIRDGLNKGQFEPFFQPKVNIIDGHVSGCEALARWRHPVKGVIAPYAFITEMENNGLIDQLTWKMLEKAAQRCREWMGRGLDATVSVNLSLKSLSDSGLADHVTELVAAQKLSPKNMVLEITESAAMTDLGKALENLTRLRMKGFGLSIDDYGTGYSSMQQLSRIPFTELKIDQGFVLSAIENSASKVILSSSLEMAKKLKLKSVAEGVETQAHWNLLKSLGCDIAQGYFVAKPMDAKAFEDWILEWTPPE